MNDKLQGFSLIEFMLSCALSLVMLLGLITVYTSVQHTFYLQQALAQLQENGRFASYYLLANIQQLRQSSCVSSKNFLPRVKGAFRNSMDSSQSIAAKQKIVGDMLSLLQCQNNQATYAHYFVAKTTYLNEKKKPVYVLFMQLDGMAKRILVDDVADMKIRYGIACSNPSAVCDFVTADRVSDWHQVRAIEIALLFVSSEEILAKPERFYFDGKILAASRYLRREWDIYASLL